jgi:hypothetical protein
MSTAKLLAEVWHPKLTGSRLKQPPIDVPVEVQAKCSWEGVGMGLLKNIFMVIGKISGIVQSIINFSAISPDKLNNECMEFGEDIGVFIRVALAF